MSPWFLRHARQATGCFLVLMFVSAAGWSTLAQQVDFANSVPFATPADRKVYAPGGTPLVGSHFVAQLYYGRSADSLTAVTASPCAFRPTVDEGAGTWLGASRQLTGMAIGETAILQVRAWDSTGGLSYDAAVLAGRVRGESATFAYLIPPNGLGAPDAYYMENFRGFTLVPEPSSVALVIGGMTGLLIFKRRKSSAWRSSYPSWPKD